MLYFLRHFRYTNSIKGEEKATYRKWKMDGKTENQK